MYAKNCFLHMNICAIQKKVVLLHRFATGKHNILDISEDFLVLVKGMFGFDSR